MPESRRFGGEPGEPGGGVFNKTINQINKIAVGVYPGLSPLLPEDIKILDTQSFRRTVENVSRQSVHPEFLKILQDAAGRRGITFSFTPESMQMYASYSTNKLYVDQGYIRTLRTPSDVFGIGNQLAEHVLQLGSHPGIYDGQRAQLFIPNLLANMQNEGGIAALILPQEKERLIALAARRKSAIVTRGSSMRVSVDGKNVGPLFDAVPAQVTLNYLARPIKQEFIRQLLSQYQISEEELRLFNDTTYFTTTTGGPHNPDFSEQAVLFQLAGIGLRSRKEIFSPYIACEIPALFYGFK